MLRCIIVLAAFAVTVSVAASVFLARELLEAQAVTTKNRIPLTRTALAPPKPPEIDSQVPARAVITKNGVPLTKIVVAKKDLFLCDPLTRENVEEREWPTRTVPAGVFTNIDKLIAENRVVLRSVAANEPIQANKISGKDRRVPLAAIIPETMRLVAIRVNDGRGAADLVLPGDRVDISLTYETTTNQPFTGILLQNIKVLGTDQRANRKTGKPNHVHSVSVVVTLKQAQKLTLAQQVGSLSLARTPERCMKPDKIVGWPLTYKPLEDCWLKTIWREG